jgi:RimJ/RimL family protein N-acetyltransferase
MHRTVSAPLTARFPQNVATGWQARRWYYTPKTHRAYSVRQIAPGDRRLLAEFALALNQATADRDLPVVRELSDMLFDRVLGGSSDMATGFAALESAGAGDRVIGVAAYAPENLDHANFSVAVAPTHRDEQVGRILLATLIRHAKRVGIRRIAGEMNWANRPMQLLAQSMGFTVETLARDRNVRRLVLCLK